VRSGSKIAPVFRRRSLVAVAVAPLIVGIVGLSHLMSEPQFAAYRAVDVVQLTGSGACFGVALLALVLYFRLPKE